MTETAAERLRTFIERDMRMSHIYQPVMLRVLLQGGGKASREEIAKAFLQEDRSQIKYYETIVARMPGRVLGRHGVVEREGPDYRLAPPYDDLTDAEREELVQLCDERLAGYLEKSGQAPWQHRSKAHGYVSGSLRYDLIRRASGRCQACGVTAEKRALEVDHIVPRNKGGSDEKSNLQVLCYLCNAQKRDRDDTDFASVLASYEERDHSCPFCDPSGARQVSSNALALVLRDAYPVTTGHTLVVPRRHVADFFDLHQPEHNAVMSLVEDQRLALLAEDATIKGFNVGINAGVAAGQTVMHVHVHLIPRRTGDTADPRGGVRGVIPGKQSYTAEPET